MLGVCKTAYKSRSALLASGIITPPPSQASLSSTTYLCSTKQTDSPPTRKSCLELLAKPVWACISGGEGREFALAACKKHCFDRLLCPNAARVFAAWRNFILLLASLLKFQPARLCPMSHSHTRRGQPAPRRPPRIIKAPLL